ncbi:NAD(P)/FAD-dependent oxidoreductase [Arthrobacter oryzae]|uniref:NAD(P)/FAD-dependent oxidoreductase n=1 Tax=Arthrobacter oryzae TaxID=409290 RepID=UPI0027808A98|nr:FAD-dependent oxidoreductase [Arthrobacter oryzae]MDQ0078575.1 3-phenylpropionate/trans-cinnamate dioxygenase ferredoxin reductase subunit [Arthrobacter oryzae]
MSTESLASNSDSPPSRVLIIGAGHAGAATAASLRQYGHTGTITIVGDEDEHPYHRPPISKAYLHGDAEADLLRDPSYYIDQNIELKLGRRVESLDLTNRTATLDDSSEHGFDELVLATGARARTLTHQLPERGCWSLRTFRDAIGFRSVLESRSRIVIIGGGFVGLEVAAAARSRGCEVTVIEREQRLLQRVASPHLSEALTALHRDKGVDVLVNAALHEIVASRDGGVEAVILEDGRRLPCGAVVIGVGAEPRDELLRQVGAECDGGVIVDSSARSSLPGVYAVGDVTRREVPGYPGRIRLESIPNATEQAKQAAAAITGRTVPRSEVPWFWSDQYDANLKIAGLLAGSSRTIVRGNPSSGSFAIYHLDDADRLLAVEAVNAPRDFMAGKKWITSGASPSIDLLPDLSVPLRDLVPA